MEYGVRFPVRALLGAEQIGHVNPALAIYLKACASANWGLTQPSRIATLKIVAALLHRAAR